MGFALLQVGMEQLKSVTDPTSSDWTTSAIVIGIIVGVNFLLIAAQLISTIINGKKENTNYRIRKISDISIEVEAEIYVKLLQLSEYTKGEEHNLLDAIIELEKYIKLRSVYISSKIAKDTEELLDYFRRIDSDFSKKDIKKEEKLIDKYRKDFNCE